MKEEIAYEYNQIVDYSFDWNFYPTGKSEKSAAYKKRIAKMQLNKLTKRRKLNKIGRKSRKLNFKTR